MKIKLHIGAPKTGSSAIQYFLLRNQKRLLKDGYYYPDHSHDGNKISGGHAELGKLLVDGDIDSAKSLIGEWKKEAQKLKKVMLISTEAAFGRSQLISDLFTGYDVEVICYIRNPLDSLVSRHNQMIKRHFYKHDLQHYLERVMSNLNEEVDGTVLSNWAELLGAKNFLLRFYDSQSFSGGSIETDFLDCLGVKGFRARRYKLTKERINNSYSINATEFKRLLNHVLSDCHEEKPLALKIDRSLQQFSDTNVNKEKRPCCSEQIYNELAKTYNVPLQQAFDSLNVKPPATFFNPERIEVSAKRQNYSLLDLLEVADFFKRKAPNEYQELKNRVEQQLTKKQVCDYAVYRLADLFGVPYFEPPIAYGLPAHSMKLLTDKATPRHELLKEVGKLMYAQGQLKQSVRLLTFASELAPKSKGIRLHLNRARGKFQKEKARN